MLILKIGIVVAVAVTAILSILLYPDTPQLKEFLALLSPAYLIIIISVLSKVTTRKNIKHSKNVNIRRVLNRIFIWIVSAIFILDIAGVSALYVFSRDGSFNDWPYGHWQVDDPESVYASIDNIPKQNVKAVKEARKILLPLCPYIVESCNAHDVSPEAVATFILVNRMFRDKYPTYNFHYGLTHMLWHLRVFPEQRNMFDSSPLYRSEVGRWFLRVLPTHIRLQDRAADFLGGIIMNGSTSMGNTQVRANQIFGFEQEKSVRADDLWRRLDIDVSKLSNREINWLLLTNRRLDIEAGVAALAQSIDETAALQDEGCIVCCVDLSSLANADWFYLFSEISGYKSGSAGNSPRLIESHDLTGCYIQLEPGDIQRMNYVEYYAIVIQSRIFEDDPNAGEGS